MADMQTRNPSVGMRETRKGGRRQAPISIHHEQNPEICEIPVRRAAPHFDWQFLKLPRRQVPSPSFRHQTWSNNLAPYHSNKDTQHIACTLTYDEGHRDLRD